ncbi:hypothetical protein SAMN05444157_1658 [Frankineae bacterium MT45]|nr:hypothetical protein SAMN05444157_1658 [Frankineae bacterium MT45]
MDAAIHAGAAVELMAKAVLAHLDPRLLAAGDNAHHALLDVLAEQGRASVHARTKAPASTVIASSAVDLAARCADGLRTTKAAGHAALQARNAAAHAALVDEDKLADVVAGMNVFTLAGVDCLRRDRADFVGRERLAQVEREAAQRDSATQAAASSKVSAAKAQYRHLTDPLGTDGVGELLRILGSRPEPPSDISETVDCPACDNNAWLLWNVEVDVEYEGPGEYSTYAYAEFIALDCPYCGLHLDEAECEAIEVPTDHDEFG